MKGRKMRGREKKIKMKEGREESTERTEGGKETDKKEEVWDRIKKQNISRENVII
jgi:hypothetical protein